MVIHEKLPGYILLYLFLIDKSTVDASNVLEPVEDTLAKDLAMFSRHHFILQYRNIILARAAY